MFILLPISLLFKAGINILLYVGAFVFFIRADHLQAFRAFHCLIIKLWYFINAPFRRLQLETDKNIFVDRGNRRAFL